MVSLHRSHPASGLATRSQLFERLEKLQPHARQVTLYRKAQFETQYGNKAVANALLRRMCDEGNPKPLRFCSKMNFLSWTSLS